MDTDVQLLGRGNWASTLSRDLRQTTEAVKLSLFLLAPRWHTQAPNLLADLVDCAARGLQCRAILSAHPIKIGKRRPNVESAAVLQAAGWEVRIMSGKSVLHEKVCILDQSAVYIGSHNFSISSAMLNWDTSVRIARSDIVNQAIRAFWERWRLARVPEANDWERRPYYELPFTP